MNRFISILTITTNMDVVGSKKDNHPNCDSVFKSASHPSTEIAICDPITSKTPLILDYRFFFFSLLLVGITSLIGCYLFPLFMIYCYSMDRWWWEKNERKNNTGNKKRIC